jgi:hypothetical protein
MADAEFDRQFKAWQDKEDDHNAQLCKTARKLGLIPGVGVDTKKNPDGSEIDTEE